MNSVQSTGTGGGSVNKKGQKNDEELVINTPSERNWRGIFIALLVIIAVLGLIVFSIMLVSPPEEGPRTKGIRPTLEDLYGPRMPQPVSFNGTWISDTEFVFKDTFGGLSLFNADNLTTKSLVLNSTFRQYNDLVDFKVSHDLRYILLITNIHVDNGKFKKMARYYVYDMQARIQKPLSPKELDNSAPLLQYATWAYHGTALVFVHNNDIYYKPKVEKDLVCRITNSGVADTIFNGLPDGLYEREILHTDHTIWFSPDSQYLLYATFNDSQVQQYQYQWYGDFKYPQIRSFRYPEAAGPNPDVSLWIVNLTRPKYLFPSRLQSPPGAYLTYAGFYGSNNVASVWLNREQNVSTIMTCEHGTGYNCTVFHLEKEHIGWTERIFRPVFSKSGNQALVRLPVKDGEKGHYMHVCLLQSGQVLPITHGQFEVLRILHWDEDKQIFFALATNEQQPGTRHLFKMGVPGSGQQWECLTCQATIISNSTWFYELDLNETLLNASLLGDQLCTYNNVIFSKDAKYYVQECLGPGVPVLFLVETVSNQRIMVMDTSSKLERRIRSLSKPQVRTIQVEIEFGFTAQVRLYLPPILRDYEEVAYPLILLVDAAPGSQLVSSRWTIGWWWFLAVSRSYVVAEIDARGSGQQGIGMRKEIKGRVGTVEVQDQLAVVAYLRDTFRFIDRNKICVVGKGYGGYVAAMMILQDFQMVINCSVSINPITTFKYYNSYFTEKYLGMPSTNLLAYENADLTIRAASLDKRRFLLIHGTADQRVPSRHSVMLAKALIDHNVLFQHLVYPDEDHDFRTVSLLHMYKQIDLFFNESFGPALDEWSDESISFFI